MATLLISTFVSWGMGTVAATIFAHALLTIGASLIAKALAKKPQNPGIKIDLQFGDNVSLSFVVGRAPTGGKRKYMGSWGKNTRMITEVIEYSGLPQGFDGIWVGEEKGELNTSFQGAVQGWIDPGQVSMPTAHATGTIPLGWHDIGTPVTNFNSGTNGFRMYVKAYTGEQLAADPYLVWAFGDDPDYPWTTDFIGTGKSYVIITSVFDRDTLSTYPRFVIEPRPLKLYDLRKDSTNGGSGPHRWGVPSTYEETTNPAIIAYNIARGIYYGTEWVYGGKDNASWRLPKDYWIAAANAHDELTDDGDGGQEPMNQVGLEISVETFPAEALSIIGLSSNMQFVPVGGMLIPIVGIPSSPVAAIVDQHFLITQGQSLDPFKGISESYNAISAQYPEPEERWTMKDAPEYIDADATARDRGRYRPVSMNYDAAFRVTQVQRLQQSQMREYNREIVHQGYLPPAFYGLIPGVDLITWTSTYNGYTNKQFLVDSVAMAPGMGVLVSLREVDNSDYDPPDVYVVPPITTPVIYRPPAQVITDLTVTPVIYEDNNGNERRAGIAVGCDGDEPGVEWIQIQARLLASPNLVVDTVRPFNQPYVWYLQEGIIPNTTYEVRARLISELLPESTWSSWITVTTSDVLLGEDDISDDVWDAITEIALQAGITPVTVLPPTGEPDQVVMLIPPGRLYRWDDTAGAWTDHVFGGIEPGSVGITEIASSITPPLTWTGPSLPVTHQGSDLLFWAAPNGPDKLYHWDGTKYTATVDAEDVDIEIGASNLARNSGFLDVTPLLWAFWVGLGVATLSFEDGLGFGCWCKVTKTSANAAAFGVRNVPNFAEGYKAGKDYVVSFYAKAPTGNPQIGKTLTLRWNVPGPTIQQAISNPPLTDQPQRYAFKIRFAADKPGEIVLATFPNNGPTNPGDEVWFTQVQVEQGNVVTAYAPRVGEILPGTIGTTEIADGAATAAKIADAAINLAKFATGIRPVEIVTSLPVTGNIEGRQVYLTTDDKLYRWTGSAWVATVAAGDVTGQLTNAQIADIAAAKITGQITSTQIGTGAVLVDKLADNAVTTAKLADGSATGAKIADAAISIAKFAAGIRPVEIVSVLPTTGNIEGRQVYLTTDDKMYRWTGSAWISTVAAGDVTGQLTDSQIADINAAKIAGQITGVQISDNAVSAAKIAAGAVVAGKLAANSVVAGNIATNAVTASAIAAGAVTTAKLDALAVTADKLAANSVVAGKIAAAAVSTTELAAYSVTASRMLLQSENLIPNGDLSTGTLAGWDFRSTASAAAFSVVGGVDMPAGAPSSYAVKIADSAVNSGIFAIEGWQNLATRPSAGLAVKPGDKYLLEISVAKGNSLPANSVLYMFQRNFAGTWAQGGAAVIFNNTTIPAVDTWVNFSVEYTVPAGICRINPYILRPPSAGGPIYFTRLRLIRKSSAELIVDGAITAAKIAAGAIEAGKIAAGAVTANELAVGAVTADKIAANAVTAIKIAAGAIEAGKLAAGAVVAGNIAANAVTTGTIAAGAVTTAKLDALAVTADKIAANAIVAGKIAAGAVSTTELAAGAVTAEKLFVGAFANMVPNGNFDDNDNARIGNLWTAATSGGARSYLSKSTNATFTDTGVGALLLQKPAGDLTVSTVTYTLPARWFAVEGGVDYYLETAIKTNHVATVNGAYIRIHWKNAAGTDIGYSYIVENGPVTMSWVKHFRTVTSPADAVWGEARVTNHSTQTTNQNLFVDRIIMKKMDAGSLIVDGAIIAAKIAADAITAGKIAANAVTATTIAAGAVIAGKIAADAVTAATIAAEAVVAGKIATNAVTTNTIAANAITSAKIAADAITAGKIAAGAVAAREIAAGAILASKIAIGDPTNYYLDPGYNDSAILLIQASASASTIVNSSINDMFGRYLNLVPTALGTLADIYTTWMPIEAATEYLFRGATWAPAAGAPAHQVWVQFASKNGDTYAYVTQVTVLNVATPGTSPQFVETSFTTPASAAAFRLLYRRAGGGTATAAYFGGVSVRKKNPGSLVVDGAITADKLAVGSVTADAIAAEAIVSEAIAAGAITAEKLNVDWLQAGRLKAEYLDIETLLTILPGGALSYGKTSVQDESDGIYFGRDGTDFGFAASRTTVAYSSQMIRVSDESGLELRNARHYVSAPSQPTTVEVTSSTGIVSLPSGTTTITIEGVGGGAAGRSIRRTTITPYEFEYWDGGSGGNTIVKLYDGGTLKETYTFPGAISTYPEEIGLPVSYCRGVASAYASGGMYPVPEATLNGYPGSKGSGGGGGRSRFSQGSKYQWSTGYGGQAAAKQVVLPVDLSGYANPKIEVTIGAGGAPTDPSLSNTGLGGAGGAGYVKYTYSGIVQLPADVIPLDYQASGTVSFGTTTVSFPDLGPGMWFVWSNQGCYVYPEATGGNQFGMSPTTTSTFFSKTTPRVTRISSNGTLTYYFRAMTTWGG